MEEKSKAAPIEPKSLLLEPGEKILGTVQKFWFGLFAIYLSAALVAGAISLMVILILSDPNSSLDASLFGPAVGVAVLVFGTFLLIALIAGYIYRQSNLTITDRSLVQVVQNSLFNKKVSHLSMSNVEDVNAEQAGFFQTVFGYGTLTVQTAGEEDNFVFKLCPRPNEYAEKILAARQRYADTHLDSDK